MARVKTASKIVKNSENAERDYRQMKQLEYDELYLLQQECSVRGIHELVSLMTIACLDEYTNELEAYRECMNKIITLKKND